jgi:hypothetical protein
MSVLTYLDAASESAAALETSFLRRFLTRFVAQAAWPTRELKQHSHLLPRELDQVFWKIGERSGDSLPFLR